ncbi:TonB-dependent receptor [Bacteroides sp. 519]|uniref:TonB-dependent receptor n=1 Tax=Bacteroides sp. 519 TaxID=2302937 RepID=UPI0013D1A5D4|nr:TonB-dependent receptor [Bacteroides sp. 519]
MKLSMFIPLLISAQLYAVNGFSQAAKVTLNTSNEISLEQLISEIEKQTEYLFIYSKNEVSLTTKVKVTARNEPVSKILEEALSKTSITYKLSGNYITLMKNKEIQAVKQAQPVQQVKGKVIDTQGQNLIGVVVNVKGTDRNVITNLDGYYVINANQGETLVFSFMGFSNIEKKVPASLSVDVVMEEDVTALDEIVIVGMGTQRKASVVGAISSVRVAELKTPARSLTNALGGRLAGIVAVQRSGEPGYDNSDFWIRGISTFGANRSPLVLVDGVERSMDNLDPEEVESVSILKDASATAVYGVRAANGVVLVTTRKGEAATKPSIELKMEYGISKLTRVPRLLDGVGYMRLYNEAAGKEIYSEDRIQKTMDGTDPYLYPNVNWLDEIFKDHSDNSIISLNVHGGGQVARYFVSVGVLTENGNFRNNSQNAYKSNISLNRYNFRTNIDVSLSKTTNLDIELGGYLIDSHYPGTSTGDLFGKAYVANPVNMPINYPYGTNRDGSTKYVWAGSNSVTTENPVERLMGSGFTTEFRNQITGQVRLTQDFGFILKGLKANIAYSFDAYSQTFIERKKKDSYYLANGRDENGELELVQTHIGDEYLGYGRSLSSNRAMELKLQVNYDRIFGDIHRVGAMAMYYQRDFRNGNAGSAIESLPYRKQGIAFRTTYALYDRYFAEFNLGYNGSENFPKGQRFGIFPAGAVGYLISNENFWQNSNISRTINMLKLKGSVGLVGAEALPGGRRYSYLTIVDKGLGDYKFGWDETGYGGTGENQFGVSNLTWEKGLKSNIGFQAEFFDGTFSLELDYFHEKRSSILVQRGSLPSIVGINDKPFANLGEMRNQGLDGTLEMSHTFGKLFTRLYANATYTRNKILEQDEPAWLYEYQNRTGKKLDQNFGLIALGYFKDEAEIANSPQQQFGNVRPGDIKYLDVNGDGVINSYDEVAIGHSNIPELLYGFGVQLGYKGFDVGLFFRGQTRVSYMLGGEGFVPFQEGGDRGNLFVEALDRWTVEDPRQDAFYPRLSIGGTENNYRSSTKWLYDGSFLRLADVEIGYTVPRKLLRPLHITGLRIYFHGTNMALFSKFKMWDPETGKGRGDAYPLPRKMNVGLRVNF